MRSIADERAIKVTFCVYDKPDSVGGPVTWIQRLVPALRDRGIEPRCLFLLHWGASGPALDYLQSVGIDCTWVVAHDRTIDRVQWILERLKENPPDVFVPNLVVAGYFAARWAREAGIPTVGMLHSDDNYYRAIQNEFVFGDPRYRLSSLVCVSKELERQVISRKPQSTVVSRVPYGVPIPADHVNAAGSSFRIAYVGRLAEEQKRIGDVTRAFCRVVSKVEGTDAVIYGDGPDSAHVSAILDKEGKGLPVILKGSVPSSEIQSELMHCHAIVLLSEYEGLPIALLEAMACGCVPVCLRIESGIPELVRDGETGLLVTNRGDEFDAAIARLRNDPALWKRLSQGARKSVALEFSNAECADRWFTLLRGLSTSQTPRPIRMPRRLTLPNANSALEGISLRTKPESNTRRFYRKARMSLGRLRRFVFRR